MYNSHKFQALFIAKHIDKNSSACKAREITPKQSLTSNRVTNEHKSKQLGGGSSMGWSEGIGDRSLPQNDLCIQGLALSLTPEIECLMFGPPPPFPV